MQKIEDRDSIAILDLLRDFGDTFLARLVLTPAYTNVKTVHESVLANERTKRHVRVGDSPQLSDRYTKRQQAGDRDMLAKLSSRLHVLDASELSGRRVQNWAISELLGVPIDVNKLLALHELKDWLEGGLAGVGLNGFEGDDGSRLGAIDGNGFFEERVAGFASVAMMSDGSSEGAPGLAAVHGRATKTGLNAELAPNFLLVVQ